MKDKDNDKYKYKDKNKDKDNDNDKDKCKENDKYKYKRLLELVVDICAVVHNADKALLASHVILQQLAHPGVGGEGPAEKPRAAVRLVKRFHVLVGE